MYSCAARTTTNGDTFVYLVLHKLPFPERYSNAQSERRCSNLLGIATISFVFLLFPVSWLLTPPAFRRHIVQTCRDEKNVT